MPPDHPVNVADRNCSCRRTLLAVAAWVVAIVLAALLDPWAADLAKRFLADVYPLKNTTLAAILKIPGEWYGALAAALVALWLHPWKWRAGGLLTLTVLIGGLAEVILKWTVGRRRPDKGSPYELDLFVGGLGGFGRESNLTFPSGHATCAFATAAALALLFPRWRWLFYAVAAVTALERVLERAHYLSDVVAAAAVGVLCVKLAAYLGNKLVNRNPPIPPHPPLPPLAPLETARDPGQAQPQPASGRGDDLAAREPTGEPSR